MQIPWTTTPQGFTTQIVADLYKVECQTSMDYRPFLEADEVHVSFLSIIMIIIVIINSYELS